MSDPNEGIKRRILGLMAKSIENGCTEEEAMAAAEKVQELLHQYQLELSDIQIKDSKCTTQDYDTQQRSEAMIAYVLFAISKFTDTRVWSTRNHHGNLVYKFFGLEHDVLIAEYITKICDWAIIRGGEDFKDTPRWMDAPKDKRGRLKSDFQYGMACRLSQRIKEMKKRQQDEDIKTTGRDLVVVKSAVVDAEFEKLGLIIGGGKRSRARRVDGDAFRAGSAAADAVALNPGVNQRHNERLA